MSETFFWMNRFLEIWGCFFQLDFLEYWFFPLMALALLATVPRILRSLFLWR